MHSCAKPLALAAALLATPLVASAQLFDRSEAIERNRLTLLNGPTLTSPARQGPLAKAAMLKPIAVLSVDGVPTAEAEFIAEMELKEVRQKLEAAQARLEKLKAERAAALARKKVLDETRTTSPATPPKTP